MKLFNVRSIIFIIILILSAALYFFTEARYAALLLVILGLILITALVTANLTGRNLRVSLITPGQGVRGESAHVTIKASNKTRLPVFLCKVKTVAENLLTDERDEFNYSLSMGRGKESTADFLMKEERCGCIKISLDDIRVSDPLGLLNVKPKTLEVDNQGSGWIYFLPKATDTMIPPEKLASYDMESYHYSPLRSGSDPSETFDIRGYKRNDSYKAIHWKLTSKMDEIMIREFGHPIENKVMIVVDKSLADRKDAEDTIEHAADFISSLSFTLLQQGVNHTIGWYNYLENEFQTFKVEDETTYWHAVRELVSSPFRVDEMSAAAHFIESDSSREFSSYIYISDDGKDMERLMNYGAVSLYRTKEFE